MAKNRTIRHLECKDCGDRNYSWRGNPKKTAGGASGKLTLSKYCSKCRKHCTHKETK